MYFLLIKKHPSVKARGKIKRNSLKHLLPPILLTQTLTLLLLFLLESRTAQARAMRDEEGRGTGAAAENEGGREVAARLRKSGEIGSVYK